MILELKVGNFKGTWASIYSWEGRETEKNTEKERERERVINQDIIHQCSYNGIPCFYTIRSSLTFSIKKKKKTVALCPPLDIQHCL